jgi:hypothetical protein
VVAGGSNGSDLLRDGRDLKDVYVLAVADLTWSKPDLCPCHDFKPVRNVPGHERGNGSGPVVSWWSASGDAPLADAPMADAPLADAPLADAPKWDFLPDAPRGPCASDCVIVRGFARAGI